MFLCKYQPSQLYAIISYHWTYVLLFGKWKPIMTHLNLQPYMHLCIFHLSDNLPKNTDGDLARSHFFSLQIDCNVVLPATLSDWINWGYMNIVYKYMMIFCCHCRRILSLRSTKCSLCLTWWHWNSKNTHRRNMPQCILRFQMFRNCLIMQSVKCLQTLNFRFHLKGIFFTMQ